MIFLESYTDSKNVHHVGAFRLDLDRVVTLRRSMTFDVNCSNQAQRILKYLNCLSVSQLPHQQAQLQ